MAPYILTIGLNPVWQTVLAFPELRIGEVNRSREYSSCCSGKGLNVTRVLHQADIAVKHLTYIDSLDGAFYRSAREQNLPVEYIPSTSSIRGCYTLLDQKGASATEIVEQGKPVPTEAEEEMMSAFGKLLTGASLVIISGSHADGFSRKIYPEISRRTKNAGKILLLDIRGDELQDCLKYGPDLIKPNREEFCQTFLPEENYHKVSESRLEGAMLGLYGRWKTSTILTNGEDSTLICYRGEISRSQPEILKKWVNPIGCGDAYTAGLAVELSRGKGITDAVKRAEEFARRNAMSFIPGDILLGE